MTAVLMTLIAVAGVALVAITALRRNQRGFLWLASRMDSLERRMAVLESYMRQQPPKVNRISPRDDAAFAKINEELASPGLGNKPA